MSEELGRCGACSIRQSGLCNALSTDELVRFREIANLRAFPAGQRILLSDEKSEFFSAVFSGVVKVTKLLFDGRQQMVGLLMPPDCLGRVYGKTNTYFAEAATKVELCCFPRRRFEQMLDMFPNLKQRLLEQTLDELDSARDWMVLLGRKTAEERVASLFLALASRAEIDRQSDAEDAQERLLELHLRRDEIADFLGMSYETVCRQITALQKQGLITRLGRRRFSVADLAALEQAAG